MKLLLLILFVVSVACDPFDILRVPVEYVGNVDQPVICVSTRMSHCQNKFADSLNMSETAGWSDPNAMGQTLAVLYTSGVSGLIKVCNARQAFQECLGDSYTSCMSIPRFVQAGETPMNALAYTQIFNALEFDCNGGFVQASTNWACILGVWTTQTANLEICATNFNNTVFQDPTKICQATYTYESCTRQYFGAGCNAEASWWMCERTRVGMQLDQWCPSSFCPVLQYKKNPVAAPMSASRREGLKRIIKGNEAENVVRRMIAEKNKLKNSKQI